MKFTESILERLDPRTKIISFLLIILCLILFPVKSVKDYGLFFLLILVIALLSRVTPKQILKKLILLIPFILFITMLIPFFKEGHTYWSIKIGKLELDIAYEGIQTFIKIFIKSSLSILLIVIASFTITFSDFLKGLEMLHFPRLLVMLMSFMYRYIFVLLDEAKRLMRARSIRYFGSRYIEQFKIIGYIIGILFIRTFERAEKIYSAMVTRGFNGEVPCIKCFKFSYFDILFLSSIIIFLMFIVSGLFHKMGYLNINNPNIWQAL